jgi:hypothetical protein
MLNEFLQTCKDVMARYGGNPQAASAILSDLYAAPLKAVGVGRIVAVNKQQVALTIHGRLTRKPPAAKFLKAGPKTIDLWPRRIAGKQLTRAAAVLEETLNAYVMDGVGAYVWIVPDGYMAELSRQEQRWEREGGGYFSHESMCVQNTGVRPTRCELTVYFEAPGRDVLRHQFEVPALRSIHLRLDKIPGIGGAPFIPKSMPAGYRIVSRDEPVVVQGSRILTSGKDSEFASFGTAMAWAPA